MCMTNFATACKIVKSCYKRRWDVETSFRRLKSNLNLETCHSNTLGLYEQEIEARILLDTLTISEQQDQDYSILKYRSYLSALDVVREILFVSRFAESRGPLISGSIPNCSRSKVKMKCSEYSITLTRNTNGQW